MSGLLEELDTFFEIGLIRSLVLLDVSQTPLLVPAPVGRHAIEESGVDSAVELVDVGAMEAVSEAVVFGLKASDRGRRLQAGRDRMPEQWLLSDV